MDEVDEKTTLLIRLLLSLTPKNRLELLAASMAAWRDVRGATEEDFQNSLLPLWLPPGPDMR